MFCDNEGYDSWRKFFRFVKKIYPEIDREDCTFISDQDKGLLKAYLESLLLPFPFKCKHHRLANIVRQVRGGDIELAKSLYQALMNAKTAAQFEAAKNAVKN